MFIHLPTTIPKQRVQSNGNAITSRKAFMTSFQPTLLDVNFGNPLTFSNRKRLIWALTVKAAETATHLLDGARALLSVSLKPSG